MKRNLGGMSGRYLDLSRQAAERERQRGDALVAVWDEAGARDAARYRFLCSIEGRGALQRLASALVCRGGAGLDRAIDDRAGQVRPEQDAASPPCPPAVALAAILAITEQTVTRPYTALSLIDGLARAGRRGAASEGTN